MFAMQLRLLKIVEDGMVHCIHLRQARRILALLLTWRCVSPGRRNDPDFEEARYTRAGGYATMRLKFDQFTSFGMKRHVAGPCGKPKRSVSDAAAS